MNQPILAQLSTKLSTGQLFIMVAQESLKNSRAMLLNGAYTGGILCAYQENSAIYQKKLFFNPGFSNPFKKFGTYRSTPISGIFKILTDLSTTLFHVEPA